MPETWKTGITYKIQRREVKDFLISLAPQHNKYCQGPSPYLVTPRT